MATPTPVHDGEGPGGQSPAAAALRLSGGRMHLLAVSGVLLVVALIEVVAAERGLMRRVAALGGMFIIINATGLGCATHRLETAEPAALSTTALAFLQEDTTSKDELVSRLGEPSSELDAGRILTYRLDSDFEVLQPLEPVSPRLQNWRGVRYSLVAVFTEAGVLVEHSVTRVR